MCLLTHFTAGWLTEQLRLSIVPEHGRSRELAVRTPHSTGIHSDQSEVTPSETYALAVAMTTGKSLCSAFRA